MGVDQVQVGLDDAASVTGIMVVVWIRIFGRRRRGRARVALFATSRGGGGDVGEGGSSGGCRVCAGHLTRV